MTTMTMASALAEQRQDEDRGDDDRQRQQHVDEAHDDLVGEPPVEARDEADDAAPEQGEDGRQRRDDEHGAGAGHGAGEHVAPEVVGAEPVRRAGRLERRPPRRRAKGLCVINVGEERHEDPEEDDDEAGHEGRAAQQRPARGSDAGGAARARRRRRPGAPAHWRSVRHGVGPKLQHLGIGVRAGCLPP